MPKVLRTTEDWDKSIIYSWIEFDGMMYIQQNGISGIQDIVNQAVENTSEVKLAHEKVLKLTHMPAATPPNTSLTI